MSPMFLVAQAHCNRTVFLGFVVCATAGKAVAPSASPEVLRKVRREIILEMG
jgi:hypothetical protein